MPMIKCLECGKLIKEDAISCPNCGCNPLALMRVRKPDKVGIIYDGEGNEIGKDCNVRKQE